MTVSELEGPQMRHPPAESSESELSPSRDKLAVIYRCVVCGGKWVGCGVRVGKSLVLSLKLISLALLQRSHEPMECFRHRFMPASQRNVHELSAN